ncbi:hypothetical protein GW17_00049960 [Ensete ventricosum]|nr:hypothetical protein GW17_00049960 [Ensete ventricosum]
MGTSSSSGKLVNRFSSTSRSGYLAQKWVKATLFVGHLFGPLEPEFEVGRLLIISNHLLDRFSNLFSLSSLCFLQTDVQCFLGLPHLGLSHLQILGYLQHIIFHDPNLSLDLFQLALGDPEVKVELIHLLLKLPTLRCGLLEISL